MIVLHAFWSPESLLCLWAEDPGRIGAHSGRREEPAAGPVDHPFAARTDDLRQALLSAAGEGVLDDAVEGELTLLLPRGPQGPLPSPLLPAPEGGAGAPDGIGPFNVDAIGVPPAAALDLLLRLPRAGAETGSGPEAPALVVAPDLAVLERAARLVLDLVARGRVLPRLEGDGDTWSARWRPLRTDLGTVRGVARLVEALPDVGRAALAAEDLDAAAELAREHGGWEAVPAPSSSAIVRDLVDALTDACAREALAARGPSPLRTARRGGTRPAEAWLAALCGADPRIEADVPPDALRPLAEALDAWAAPGPGGEDAFRVSFRLHPPPEAGGEEAAEEGDGDGDGWRLELLLQSLEDPTLLIPAAEVWDQASAGRAVVATRAPDPDAVLLAGLGRAVRVLPDLEPGLRTAQPAAIPLDTDGVARLLRQGAGVLEQAGFGVFLPPFWEEGQGRLGLKLRMKQPLDDTGPGFGGWWAFSWEVALGDDVLSADELARLAALKVPLVRVKGRWVELRPEDVDRALAALRGDGDGGGRMSLIEALRLGLGAADGPGGLAVRGLEAGGPLGALLAGEGKLRRKRTPKAFDGRLRPYQERGLSWLWFLGELGLGGCLADDMGLGKTIQLLALLLAERSRRRKGGGPGPTLLVCPMSVVGNWQREAARFSPSLATLVHHGAGRLGGEALSEAAAGADLVVTTYGVVLRDEESLAAIPWHRVALDEAQNVKNPGTRIARAVRSLPAGSRVALTGTPIENRLSDLWSIMEFLNPGLLGSRKEFRERFAVPIERYGSEARAAGLRRLVRPFLLRRLKTDKGIVRDLPDKLEMKVFCHLTREQATLYKAVLDEMMERIASSDGMERRGLVLKTLTRLKQVCNHPAQLSGDRGRIEGRSGKLARLEEILDVVLDGEERALIFTQYTVMGRLLQAYLEARLGRPVPFLHGGTRRRERDALVARFQSPGGPPVFLLSLKAGGTGLNLTAATHVVHYDRWWNPAVEDQATDRTHRIGQRRDVQVRKLLTAGTLEERIDTLVEGKRDLADRVVGDAGDAWLTELSTDALREVLTLSPDAVAEE